MAIESHRRSRLGEIDGQGVLTIPGTRTKNHLEHKVPLPQLALDLISGLPPRTGRPKREHDLVFGNDRNEPPGDFSRVKAALDAEMKRLADQEGRTVAPWRTHDLRRSCASGMQALGIRHEIIEKALNHISGVLQRRRRRLSKGRADAGAARGVAALGRAC